MESSNSNLKERELQLTQRLAKQRHSNCMTWFEQLETHLHDLYLLNSPYAVDAFKPAFRSFFGEEHQTFKLKMFHNLDQLRLQLERENLHGVNAKTCLQALRTQFKEFLASKRVNATDLLNQGGNKTSKNFTRCEPSWVQLSRNIQINPIQAVDDSLIVSKSSLIETENNNAFSKSEIETPDAKGKTKDIGPVNDEEPFVEVQLTALHNILANKQQHTEQSEPNYDTHLLETIDSNTTPTSTNMCHRGGEIDEDALLNAELLKMKDMEKVFANAALKNELRKIKGNSVDTKFAKASILGKPPLQPSRNHLVVRQPNAFTSERPRISRPRFASQVDEKNDLSKTVTPHYLPKVRESAAAKPHQVNAPNYSRNSHKESYGSNDMVHAYFLEDARKMTQDKTRIPSHKDMASTRAHCTPNACTPKPRNIYRSSPVSKCSGGMSNGEPLVDHSRNSSFFLDSKQFVCSICHKYIFNTNHDDCIIKILNKVNSRAKVQSPKIRNNNPVEPKNHTHKPGRQNGIGQRFSLNKSSAVHEKPHTPRSCLRWKPTGRIFKTVSLRWIPTGKMFTDSTTKVDSEPPNGSNDDITNPYECNQTLYFSEFKEFKSDEHASNDVWTKQFKPRSSSNDFKPRFSNVTMVSAENNTSGPVLHCSNGVCPNQFRPHSSATKTGKKITSLHGTTSSLNQLSFGIRIVSGPDPEPMQEDQTGSNSGKLHVSLAGPNPEHMDDEFLVTAYLKVHENLKLITDERVIEENPESHSGSMSSMKNLDDTDSRKLTP
ncbi:hypothetical protein Tco_0238245 [Tanacetum coccineum]